MRSILHIFLLCLLVLVAKAEDNAQLVREAASQADQLLAVDAGVEHSNEAPRLARQFGYFPGGGFGFPGFGGGFGRPGFGGGFGRRGFGGGFGRRGFGGGFGRRGFGGRGFGGFGGRRGFFG